MQQKAGAIPVHGCGGCGGIWLDNDASSRVIAKINPDVVSLAQQAGVWAPDPGDEQPSIACPACSKPLLRVPGGDPSVRSTSARPTAPGRLQRAAAGLGARRAEAPGPADRRPGRGAAALAGAALAQPEQTAMAQGASNLLSSAADTLGSAGAGLIDVGGQALSAGAEVAADVAVNVVIEGAAELLIGGVCALVEGIFS